MITDVIAACTVEVDTAFADDLLDDQENAMSSTDVPNIDSCSDQCFNTAGCYYYTYISSSKTCHFKASNAGRTVSIGSESGRAC
eukprot:Awhi_evm1s8575